MLNLRIHFNIILVLTISLTILIACDRPAQQANNHGNQAFASQDYAGAIEAYELAQTENTTLSEPYYNAGNAYYRQQMFLDAISSYDQGLINANPDLTGDLLFNLGNAHFTQQAFDNAVEVYKEVLRLNPHDEDAKYNLELALLSSQTQDDNHSNQQKKQSEASENEEARRDDPEQPSAGPQTQDKIAQDSTHPEQVPNVPLNEEQALQLLNAIGNNTRTLQEHLQAGVTASTTPTRHDW